MRTLISGGRAARDARGWHGRAIDSLHRLEDDSVERFCRREVSFSLHVHLYWDPVASAPANKMIVVLSRVQCTHRAARPRPQIPSHAIVRIRSEVTYSVHEAGAASEREEKVQVRDSHHRLRRELPAREGKRESAWKASPRDEGGGSRRARWRRSERPLAAYGQEQERRRSR